MKNRKAQKPLVAILMGSASDAPHMAPAREILAEFGVPFECRVLSAHRTPDLMFRYAEEAADRGLEVIIGGAGGAAHLAGMMASKCILPIIGVPIKSRSLKGLDALLSTAQMPRGVPVATVAIGGALNAGLLAVRILALHHPELKPKLERYRDSLRRRVLASRV